MADTHTVILVDSDADTRDVLAQRLRMQGYAVTVARDAADGARLALSDPPSAIIADLWMHGISGVQVCRLLKAEAATQGVPVILRGPEGQRNRFWAQQAGAAEYVGKGRMGDLVRALGRAIELAPKSDGFFTELSSDEVDIRDRIASHLDAALFESVMAAEVRALTRCGQFDRLFDLLSQFISRVTSYRWLALSTQTPSRCGIHCHPAAISATEIFARAVLGVEDGAALIFVTDEDAYDDRSGPSPIVRPIRLGDTIIGQLAMAPRAPTLGELGQAYRDPELVTIVARELAGPIRMATLVEEAQRLATTDPLTRLMNRRAFLESLQAEIARSRRLGHPVACLLFDVDHFKQINDKRGHASGDSVLAALGALVLREARTIDVTARWGGEEFIVVLAGADAVQRKVAAERIRAAVEAMTVIDPSKGDSVPVTASFGVTGLTETDTVETLIERCDRAMYRAKSEGRNRVIDIDGSTEAATTPQTPAAALRDTPSTPPEARAGGEITHMKAVFRSH